MPDENQRPALDTTRLSLLTQISTELAGPPALGLVVDYIAGTVPWFMIGGLVLGTLVAFAHLVVFARRAARGEGPQGRPNPPREGP